VKINPNWDGLGWTAVCGVLILLAACSQSAAPPAAEPPATVAAAQVATAVTSLDPRLNPTAAVGGGINAANPVSPDDLKAALASVPQIDQLRVTANSSPAGAKGDAVLSVSITGQDPNGVLAKLDLAAKKSLAEAILTGAGTAWPKASISLLMTGSSGPIVGSRQPGGPNMVIAS
jgi:hypothetical protein